ncbi:MAG TPA: hypothetical protein VMV94_14535 [Phycisphaerae bacterium]|nr:hypothetical protein [Phycisphaerae bacterium]
MTVIPFRVCSLCGATWTTRDAFLADGSLRLDGYKPNFQAMEKGLFFITHDRDECGFTLALVARDFLDLYGGPRYTERKTFSEECPRYCLDQEQLERCVAQCEYAFVREVLQIVGNRLQAAKDASSRPPGRNLQGPPYHA